MSTGKRVFSVVLSGLMILVLILSSACIMHEADHDCIGEGCSVCAHIAATLSFISSFALMTLVLFILSAHSADVRHRTFDAVPSHFRSAALVGWKVRLND
ncbi:MAG: hypothetical protein IJ242_05215 [Clostridia bacterium]|nr:hypothetical protein [Clostridia bacterium]